MSTNYLHIQVGKNREVVTLEFRRRMYDTRPVHPHARTRVNARQRVRLNTARHTFYVERDEWSQLLRDIVTYDEQALRQHAVEVANDARNRNEAHTERTEVTFTNVGTN